MSREPPMRRASEWGRAMTEPGGPNPLKDLDSRLRAARAEQDKGKISSKSKNEAAKAGSGLGLAFRVTADIVAALAVGIVIGVLLDNWLETTPWFLIVFFIFGGAAGVLNVYRTMEGYGYAAGYQKTGTPAKDDAEDETEQRNKK